MDSDDCVLASCTANVPSDWLETKSEVKKKSLWRVLLSPLAMWTEKQPIIFFLIFNICVVGEDGSPGGTFPLQCSKEQTVEGSRQVCSTVDSKLKLNSYELLMGRLD